MIFVYRSIVSDVPWAKTADGKKPFTKSADDPRDEDVAFFYAEEANHDAEEAIFQELYGTSTTTVPPGA